MSEGRDRPLVDQIAGKQALDIHLDEDHNRSVLTYASQASAPVDACRGLVERGARLLDITTHRGVHPRYGVVDVLPLVSLGANEDAVRAVAVTLTEQIERLGVPVYLYGRADPERHSLPELRRFLRGGSHRAHETAGVVCLGVRDPLVAFNVNLEGDITRAREVARLVRAPEVRALGFELPSRGLVQVSMNLIEPDRVGPKEAFDRVVALARVRGLKLVDCEVVGLVPHPILEQLESLPLRKPVRSIEQALTEKGLG